ncbi:hypothetical protein [Breoghania sp.]|uniref:hypothetical protein n=1 Tax=Breoghania sp. TaxID=2065378 RepID=UPI002AA605B3|nr:hypothetical protein [Breoghania sp.]
MENGQDGVDRQGAADRGAQRAAALRNRTLRRLTGLEPEEGEAGRKALVARLARALRGERQRGKAGHWSYDLNRHIALSQAYRAECDALRAMRRSMRARGACKDRAGHPRSRVEASPGGGQAEDGGKPDGVM